MRLVLFAPTFWAGIPRFNDFSSPKNKNLLGIRVFRLWIRFDYGLADSAVGDSHSNQTQIKFQGRHPMLRFFLKAVLLLLLVVVLLLALLRLAAAQREKQDQSSAPPRGAFVETASTTFYVQSAGPEEGAPVLLAHGTAAWSGFWERELGLLANAGFRATAYDMPPFGYSDRAADGDYSRSAQATRILDLVATLPAPPVMVAHSFGAAAATEAVLRNPQAFKGLIIVDGAIAMNGNATQSKLPAPLRPMALRKTLIAATATNPLATRYLLRAMMHNKDAATDTYIDVLQLPQNRSDTTAAYADWLPSLLTPAVDSLSRKPANYADLPIPVRIIWGDKDTVTPPAQAEALASAINQDEVIYLAGVGHIPHIEASEAFMLALLSILEEMR